MSPIEVHLNSSEFSGLYGLASFGGMHFSSQHYGFYLMYTVLPELQEGDHWVQGQVEPELRGSPKR